jgi:hypothetical protein
MTITGSSVDKVGAIATGDLPMRSRDGVRPLGDDELVAKEGCLRMAGTTRNSVYKKRKRNASQSLVKALPKSKAVEHTASNSFSETEREPPTSAVSNLSAEGVSLRPTTRDSATEPANVSSSQYISAVASSLSSSASSSRSHAR